jgi:hypothetical protein
VILDDYTSMDVEFIAFDRPPAIFEPGATIAHPSAYSQILALSREDLNHALGPAAAAHATAVAWDPSGTPVVWAVVP